MDVAAEHDDARMSRQPFQQPLERRRVRAPVLDVVVLEPGRRAVLGMPVALFVSARSVSSTRCEQVVLRDRNGPPMSFSTAGRRRVPATRRSARSSSESAPALAAAAGGRAPPTVSSPGGLFGVSYWRRVRVSSTRTLCFGPSTENEKSNCGSAWGFSPSVSTTSLSFCARPPFQPSGKSFAIPSSRSRGRGRPPRTAARFPTPGR